MGRSCLRGSRENSYSCVLAGNRFMGAASDRSRQSESGVGARLQGILGSAARRGWVPSHVKRAVPALGEGSLRLQAEDFFDRLPAGGLQGGSRAFLFQFAGV